MRSMRMAAALGVWFCTLGLISAQAATQEPVRPAVSHYTDLLASQLDHVDRNLVVVKFAEGTGIRAQDGQFRADAGTDLSHLESILSRLGGVVLAPRISLARDVLDGLRQRAESLSGRRMPDLTLYSEIRLPALGDPTVERQRLSDLLRDLNALDIVQVAFAQPLMEVATLGMGLPVRTTTPDFSGQQGYLYDAPVGVGANAAWAFPGGHGENVKVVDIEFGWRFTHEDIKDPFFVAGEPGTDDHGTAVLGEYSGIDNGFGVTGIANLVDIGGCSVNTMSLVEAIAQAMTVLAAGDLYVIELHAVGPFDKWLPMEFWQDNFDAIQTASAAGLIGCEAAGNGSEDLDFIGYQGAFDRRVRDSGAIMCGAGTPQELTGEWFTNYGSRVDLEGWGSSVVTTCCGDLWNTGPDSTYTATFNGTSSATPIVTGSVASLQGQSLALFGERLTAGLAQEILSRSGSPWTGMKEIGERPNLLAARDLLEQGFAEVTLTVRDAATQLPLEGIAVDIAETGRLAVTPSDGMLHFQMSAGDFTFHASSFYYSDSELPVTIVAGEDQELFFDLPTRLLGGVQGVVFDDSLNGLPAARIACLGTPLAVVYSELNGDYLFDGIPEGSGYRFMVGGKPGLSCTFGAQDIIGNTTITWHPVLINAQTFESSNGGYTGAGQWQWGIPTGPGPGGAYSGQKCWATNLSGYYGTFQWMNLDSPVYDDFSDADTLLLSFHHWYWIHKYDDGGNVQVFYDGSWHIVEPVAGYDFNRIPILEAGPGFTGASDGWEDEVFNLTPYIGPSLRVRFRFASDNAGTGPGWYIDDVALDSEANSQAIELFPENPADRAQATQLMLLRPVPNPSPADTRIALRLPEEGAATLSVLDASGRRVRLLYRGTLPAGDQEIRWDGCDDAGARLAAGVYFLRLEAAQRTETRPIIRVR